MFDGSPIPPLPLDSTPIGQRGQFALLLLFCFLLVAIAYFFFEFCANFMDDEVWRDLRQFDEAHRRGKRWWQI
jgi:hypothetical protein